jgi:hypothetical protein
MRWNPLSLNAAALRDRRTRAHLLSRVFDHHSADTRAALDAGVPMDVLIALHDVAAQGRREKPPCILAATTLHTTFARVAEFVADGADPNLVIRYVRALSATGDALPSERLDQVARFVRDAVAARHSAPTTWAREQDWALEAVTAAEAALEHRITEHVPNDVRARHPHLRGTAWRSLLAAADAHDLDPRILAAHADRIPGSALPETFETSRNPWMQVAQWQVEHGTSRTALLLDAGLDGAADHDTLTDDDLASLAERRARQRPRPLW